MMDLMLSGVGVGGLESGLELGKALVLDPADLAGSFSGCVSRGLAGVNIEGCEQSCDKTWSMSKQSQITRWPLSVCITLRVTGKEVKHLLQ
jgi:hypothetical protein